jgi:hypothetical protein
VERPRIELSVIRPARFGPRCGYLDLGQRRAAEVTPDDFQLNLGSNGKFIGEELGYQRQGGPVYDISELSQTCSFGFMT